MDALQLDVFRAYMKAKKITFGDCVEAFGDNNKHWAVAGAEKHRLLEEGVLEFDAPAVVSESDDGAYVMAWLWIDRPATNEEETDE